jgi:hypothetical protein
LQIGIQIPQSQGCYPGSPEPPSPLAWTSSRPWHSSAHARSARRPSRGPSRPSDLACLAEPEQYLGGYADRLVILDEVQRAPELFPVLRGLIDRARRTGHRAGRFLMPGYASGDLLRQSGESLAGRIAYLEQTLSSDKELCAA